MRAVSFTKSVLAAKDEARAGRAAGQRHPVYALDSKLLAHRFAQILGLRVPKIYGSKVPLSAIDFRPGTVIKPVNAYCARGVFIAHHDGRIRYLNNNLIFSDPAEARAHAKDLIARELVRADSWLSEELIGGTEYNVRDIKFYMFYGEVGLVLETQRMPECKRCWYDPAGQIVKTGKYEDVPFVGGGGFAEVMELAKTISVEIPAPFARIDLLVSGPEIVFGEITPAPSSLDRFNTEWDSRLGYLFVKAASRLASDAGYGKSFAAFRKAMKSK